MSEESIREISDLSEADARTAWRVLYRKDTRETFVAHLSWHERNNLEGTYGNCGYVDDDGYATEAEAELARDVSHYYGEDRN